MKVLVVGQGGREHALVKAIKKSPLLTQVYCAPGSDGIALDAPIIPISIDQHEDLYKEIVSKEIDLVVIGPDQALADGLTDYLSERKVLVFGPSKKAAQLEWSKCYAKNFMREFEIPTAHFEIIHNFQEVKEKSFNFKTPWVLKVDGLALGKGVFICKDFQELEESAEKIFVDKQFGESGSLALLEDFTEGYELSLHVMTDGKAYQIFPMAQDHKRLLENNRGPNTGGMGTLAPISVPKDLIIEIEHKIIKPTLKGLMEWNIDYKGILFIGLIITPEGPKVLEYNCRFGDPEAQVFMPLLEGDWLEAFYKTAQGNIPNLKWSNKFAACVVMASEAYPDNPIKGVKIEGLDSSFSDHSYVLHAGTAFTNNSWVTNGGRVLNLIGIGDNVAQAKENAYNLSRKIRWPSCQFRRDIGNYVPDGRK